MEGQSTVTNKLRFVESKVKIQTGESVTSPYTKLVAAANNHDLTLIGFESSHSVKAIATSNLLDFDSAKNTTLTKEASNFVFDFTLTFKPAIVTVARYGFSSTALVIGQNQSSNTPQAAVIDLDKKSLLRCISLNELANSNVVDYAWHPNYYNSIIALCTDSGCLAVLAIDMNRGTLALVYNNPQYRCLTCCWSPKGKNLAIGMENGRIMRLEPVISTNSFNFKEVNKSVMTINYPKITPQHRLIRLSWINRYMLLSVHAKGGSCPETVYSTVTIKQSKPFRHWSNICFENPSGEAYSVYLANLSNIVICSSCMSSEAAVIGVDGAKEAEANEIDDWKSLVIDEEGARMDLPLDSNNMETYSRGITVALSSNQLILIFYTNAGLICPYAAMHSENILKVPELQQALECPMALPEPPPALPEPTLQLKPATIPSTSFMSLSLAVADTPSQNQGQSLFSLKPAVLPEPVNLQKSAPIAKPADPPKPISPPRQVPPVKDPKEFLRDLKLVKAEIEFNSVYLSMLEDITHIHNDLVELQELHKLHRDAIEVFKEEVDSLDIGILEDLYLIEYIKSRSKGQCRKKSLDPVTLKKVEQIKQKTRLLADKIKDLDVHVDVSWEDFLRRRTALDSKSRNPMRLTSLDMIYKTLAINQKIINVMKKRLANLACSPEVTKKLPLNQEYYNAGPERCEVDSNKMKVFRGFLASRCTVPVRQSSRRVRD